MLFFIIAPQKKTVNPYPWIYLIFILRNKSKTPFPALRHTGKGVLFGYCLGVRRNHVTRETVAAPLPMAKVYQLSQLNSLINYEETVKRKRYYLEISVMIPAQKYAPVTGW